jgi:hypothetical protein
VQDDNRLDRLQRSRSQRHHQVLHVRHHAANDEMVLVLLVTYLRKPQLER